MVDIERNPALYEKNRPIAVKIHDDMVWVTVADGRVIGNPLNWHPWLAQAKPEQLVSIEMDVFSIFWPDLGEGLDIEGMFQGIQPTSRDSHAPESQVQFKGK